MMFFASISSVVAGFLAFWIFAIVVLTVLSAVVGTLF